MFNLALLVTLTFISFTAICSPKNEDIVINKNNINNWGEISCKQDYGFKEIYSCEILLLNSPKKNECYYLRLVELHSGSNVHEIKPIFEQFVDKLSKPYSVTLFVHKQATTILSLSYSKQNNKCLYDRLSTESPTIYLQSWLGT